MQVLTSIQDESSQGRCGGTQIETLYTVTGIVLIFAVLADVFRTLFASNGGLTVGQLLARIFWRLLRPITAYRPALLNLAGPIAFVGTVVGWFALSALGWALVYLPHMPAGFSFDTELSTQHGGFLPALYFSFGTITTLGYGDIVPVSGWLLVLTPLEALSGLGMLLGALLWYRSNALALSRRRSLAKRITLLNEAGLRAGTTLSRIESEEAARILDDLAMRLSAVRTDLLQLPHTYYYAGRDARTSLPNVLHYLEWLTEEVSREDCDPGIRLYASALRDALDDFAMTVASRFLDVSPFPTHRVIEDYSRDHLWEQSPGDGTESR